MNELALFAGAGGGLLGSKILGWRPICAVEKNRHCQKVLLQRQRDGFLPVFPIWDDIRTFDGRPFRGSVDVVSGGFPCQDVSHAWDGKGLAGDRSGLWSEYLRVVQEVEPRYVFAENVSNIRKRGLQEVICNLAEIGYCVSWSEIGADEIGAAHERKRVWVLAWRPWDKVVLAADCEECDCCGESWCKTCQEHYAECYCIGPHTEDERFQLEEETWGLVAYPNLSRRQKQRWPCTVQKKHPAIKCAVWWKTEPGVLRLVHGMADRVERIRAAGNGQVPGVVAEAWRALTEQEF